MIEAQGCCAIFYDDRVTASFVRPVVLRGGVSIEDPLKVVLGFLKAPGQFDVGDPSRPTSFGEPDLRRANRGGARISADQIAAILERRYPIGLVRGYERDLDRNRAAVQSVRQDLAGRGYELTEVRVLDLLILSARTVT